MNTKPFIEDNVVNLSWATKTKGNNFINFGDELSFFLNAKLFPEYTFRHCHFDSKKERISSIGTILHGFCGGKTHVWGTGLDATRFRPDFLHTPLDVYAVRGKHTKHHLERFGNYVPDVFGDPAILLPRFFHKKKPTIKLGIIPHCSNYNVLESELSEAKCPCFLQQYSNEVKIISPLTLGTVEGVIEEMLSCEMILSESIHGCIISDVMHIPNMFLQKNANYDSYVSSIDELPSLEHRYADYISVLDTPKYTILHNPDLPLQIEKIIRTIPHYFETVDFTEMASDLLGNHPLNK